MNKRSEPLQQCENDLLVLCARTQIKPEQRESICRLITQELNWDYLVATAAQHGLLPFLFHNLSQHHDSIPSMALSQLRLFYATNSMRNQFLTKALIALVSDLRAEGIPVIPFKGPTLAATAYNDLSLREFIDLDLLVRQSQLARAFDFFIQKDFQLKNVDPLKNQKFSSRKTTFTFTKGEGLGEIRVDLQSLIIGEHFSVSIFDNSVWERVTEIPLSGGFVPCLAVEDLLIALCIHGSKHFWEKSKWICDVSELVQRHELAIDWQLVYQQANRMGGERMLALGLEMAFLFKTAVNSKEAVSSRPRIMAQIGQHDISATARWLIERLFCQNQKNQKIVTKKAFYLYLQDNAASFMRHYLYLCLIPLPQRYWILLRHPRLFTTFHAIVGCIRLMVKHGVRSQFFKGSIERWLYMAKP